MGRCLLCQETVSDEALADLSHLRLMHPDRYEEPILWPDGEPLIVDCTLEPDDFGGAQDDGGVCDLAHVDQADRARCSGTHIDGGGVTDER